MNYGLNIMDDKIAVIYFKKVRSKQSRIGTMCYANIVAIFYMPHIPNEQIKKKIKSQATRYAKYLESLQDNEIYF